MDGLKCGVILRAPFDEHSEDHDVMAAMRPEHVLLHTRFGSKKISKRNSTKFMDAVKEAHPSLEAEASIMVTLEDLKKVTSTIWSRTLFIELGDQPNENAMLTGVSELLSKRPDIKIGIVAPLIRWVGDETAITMFSLFAISNQIFACPIVESPIDSQLQCAFEELPQDTTVPFVTGLTEGDKEDFHRTLGQFGGKFSEIIFWSPSDARGVIFKEEVQMEEKKDENGSPAGNYRALRQVALRKSPSKGADVLGNIPVGERIQVIKIQRGKGCTFGQLPNGWVILTDNQTENFEKETY